MIRTVFFVQIVGQGIADNSDYYYKNNNPRHGVYECHSGHPFVYQIREVISPAANPRGIRALVSRVTFVWLLNQIPPGRYLILMLTKIWSDSASKNARSAI